MTPVATILSTWIDEHLKQEIKEHELYVRGGSGAHNAKAKAHARAALALSKELDEKTQD